MNNISEPWGRECNDRFPWDLVESLIAQPEPNDFNASPSGSSPDTTCLLWWLRSGSWVEHGSIPMCRRRLYSLAQSVNDEFKPQSQYYQYRETVASNKSLTFLCEGSLLSRIELCPWLSKLPLVKRSTQLNVGNHWLGLRLSLAKKLIELSIWKALCVWLRKHCHHPSSSHRHLRPYFVVIQFKENYIIDGSHSILRKLPRQFNHSGRFTHHS